MHQAILLIYCISLSNACNNRLKITFNASDLIYDNFTSNPSSVWGFGTFHDNDFNYYTSYGNYFINSQIKTWTDNLHKPNVNFNPTDINQYDGTLSIYTRFDSFRKYNVRSTQRQLLSGKRRT